MDTILLTLCIIAIVTAVTYPLVKLVRRRKTKEEQVGPNLKYDPQFLVYAQELETEYRDKLNDRLPPRRASSPSNSPLARGYSYPSGGAPAKPKPRRTHFDARERSYSLDPLYTTPLYVAAIDNNVPDTRETAPSYSGHGGEFGGSGSSSNFDSSPSPCDSGSSGGGDCGGGGSD